MAADVSIARTPDGAELRWRRIPAGAERPGAPVLLIPGQAVAASSWDPIVPALARDRDVIAFDLRGVDGSTMGSDPEWTTSMLAADALAVLRAADALPAHIVGHSMGGRIAQRLAIEHPDAVRSLVLIATTPGDAHGAPRSAEATRVLGSGGIAELTPYFFGEGADPEAMARFLRRDVPVAARRRHFEASRTHDAAAELHRIVAPTLVIHGEDDAITPVVHGRLLADGIPAAELLVEPGGHHAVHLQSAAAADAVVAFLGRADRADPSPSPS